MNKAVSIPDSLYIKLDNVARARGITVEQLLIALSATLESPIHSTSMQALIAGGLSPVTLDACTDLIDPTVDYEAVRQSLAHKHFSTALSDTIVAERG